MNILLVEDEPAHKASFVEALEDLGFRPTPQLFWSQTSHHAIKELRKRKFDVIFMDISLKGSEHNGLELTRRFKKEKDIPIVVYSISRNKEDEKKAYEAGADLYAPKPFEFDILLTTLHYVLTAVKRNEPLRA